MKYTIEESLGIIEKCESLLIVLNDKKQLRDEFIKIPVNQVFKQHIVNIKPSIINAISEAIVIKEGYIYCPKCKKQLNNYMDKNNHLIHHFCKNCGKHLKEEKYE